MNEHSRTKQIWRWFIDGIVVIIVVAFAWPYVDGFLTYDYYETLPDDVRELDESISAFLENEPRNFEELYANQQGLASYDFTYSAAEEELLPHEIYARRVASIVYITVDDGIFYYIGSGSIISSDGVIVTNQHLLQDAQQVAVTLADGTTYSVEQVIATDEVLDVAFIKIDAQNLPAMPIGDSAGILVGDTTYSIGHPEGLLNSFTIGNVSALRDFNTSGLGRQIQITNPTSQGNSGGALLNSRGELIGIPSWVIEYQDNAVQVQNLNFAIPIHTALELLSRT